MVATVIPGAELLPEVFPTERLGLNGVAFPPLRAELRKIASGRNAITVAMAYVQAFGVPIAIAALVERTGWWWLFIPTFLLQARSHALFGILSHEAAHRLLFASQKVNDVVGNWLIAPFSFTGQEAYRRAHMAHHRDPLGPTEPDLRLYNGYPVTWSTMRRRLRRDIDGESGFKLLKGILQSFRKPKNRVTSFRILGAQVILAVVFGVTIGWWGWLAFWFVPWMTTWRVMARLRAIAEHAGLQNSKDERLTTHVVRQGPLARFWMVPYNTGWHIAHHVDSGVPFRNLPRFHNELVTAGYITPGLEYPSYTALWKRLASA